MSEKIISALQYSILPVHVGTFIGLYVSKMASVVQESLISERFKQVFNSYFVNCAYTIARGTTNWEPSLRLNPMKVAVVCIDAAFRRTVTRQRFKDIADELMSMERCWEQLLLDIEFKGEREAVFILSTDLINHCETIIKEPSFFHLVSSDFF